MANSACQQALPGQDLNPCWGWPEVAGLASAHEVTPDWHFQDRSEDAFTLGKPSIPRVSFSGALGRRVRLVTEPQ